RPSATCDRLCFAATSKARALGLAREVRDLLRAPTSAAVGRAKRVPTPARVPRADRARRPARLRLRVGGRAPLPRGVLALLGAAGLSRRGEPAHEADPPRPRDHAPDD